MRQSKPTVMDLTPFYEDPTVPPYGSDANIQHAIAYCFLRGVGGMEKNSAAAVPWFRKSAEHGNVASMFYLGQCYETGDGVPKDEAAAVSWYSKADEQGDTHSSRHLARCFAEGIGVETDVGKAISIFHKIAERKIAERVQSQGQSVAVSQVP